MIIAITGAKEIADKILAEGQEIKAPKPPRALFGNNMNKRKRKAPHSKAKSKRIKLEVEEEVQTSYKI